MAKAKKTDTKTPTSIGLNAETRSLIEKILQHHDRSLSQMVEIWAKQEAEKLIKLPKQG